MNRLFILGLLFLACTENTITSVEKKLIGARVLVRDGWENLNPSWSPSGDTIIYLAREQMSTLSGTEASYIRQIEIHTGKITDLVHDSTGLSFPQLSSDGQKLVFCSGRLGERDVWLIHIGANTYERFSTREGHESFPCFSPDNKSIAYINKGQIILQSMNGNLKILATDPLDILAVCWTNTGDELLFSGRQEGKTQLYRYTLETDQYQLIGGGVTGTWPDFTIPPLQLGDQLGPQVAFEKNSGIFLASLNRSSISRIEPDGKMPNWSPDGSQLAFCQEGNILTVNVWTLIDLNNAKESK
jgi:Tol biopolymer transport system component